MKADTLPKLLLENYNGTVPIKWPCVERIWDSGITIMER